MVRPYRLQGENCFYHITSRGDDRKKIFLSDADCEKFLEYVIKAKNKYKFHLYAYCLMSNHYHLFIETLQPNLSKIMQNINTAYTTYYNKKRSKVGHLFQGRYKSVMVEEDSYFLELTRYIHLNPVRANMVKLPNEYKWSSYRVYLKGSEDRVIDIEEIRRHVDLKGYKDFVLDNINKNDDLKKQVYAGYFLGGKDFVKGKLDKFKPEIESGNFAYKRELNSDITIDEIINRSECIFNEVKEKNIVKKHSGLISRKVIIFAAKRVTPLTNKQIGEYFNIGATAVIKASNAVEGLLKEDKGLRNKVVELLSAFSA